MGVKMYFQNKYQDKKVLIIGHTGFKGSWLTLWLKLLGAKVAGFSDEIPTNPSHFDLAQINEGIIDGRGDITNYNQVLKFAIEFEPEVIFHLGARAIVSDCIENPLRAFLTNTIGTVNVLETLRHLPTVRSCVIVTSDKCYENVEWDYGYRETDRLGGKDPYSASKACAELAFSSYFRTYLQTLGTLKIASARAGNVIGGGDWATNRIIPDCIKSWAIGHAVPIRNPKSTRPWQHVLEPVSGYLALGAELLNENSKLNGESFNFGPKAEVNKSVAELIYEMQKYWSNAQFVFKQDDTLKNKEAGLLKLSCDKALSHLSWNPTLTFEETVEMTASWYKNWVEKGSCFEHSVNQIKTFQSLAKERLHSWTR